MLKVVVLVVCAGVMMPQSSYGNCAWVLWEKYFAVEKGNRQESSWSFQGVYGDMERCKGDLYALIKFNVDEIPKNYKKIHPSSVVETRNNLAALDIGTTHLYTTIYDQERDFKYTLQMRCMPDTLHPDITPMLK